MQGAVGACFAAGWRGRATWQGTWGSKRAGQAATGPMVTAATMDHSAVQSAGWYGLSPVESRARCLQAAVQAATLQLVRFCSASSALRCPLCCTT